MANLGTRAHSKLLQTRRKVLRLMWRTADHFGPEIRTRNYKGHLLFYSRGESLVGRIRVEGAYEPEVSAQITSALAIYNQPVFVDIGANIGIMTINILDQVPNARVYAFEPGPHQSTLFQKTIDANKLGGQVTLNPVAVSRETGTAHFAVHRSQDSSGDGLLDTGRAGAASYIDVPVTTLDNWWLNCGKPKVNAVKIDTEGSELWVFEGGVRFLSECRPVLFFELTNLNLHAYPYSDRDVVSWLTSRDYRVQNLAGTLVTAATVATIPSTDGTYAAYPV